VPHRRRRRARRGAVRLGGLLGPPARQRHLLTLTQDGDRVYGTYVCCGGGTIEGRIERRTLRYTWRQPGGSGDGVWTIHPGRLDGTWGIGASDRDGGRWDLRLRAGIAK
jgi:hypothetical protein